MIQKKNDPQNEEKKTKNEIQSKEMYSVLLYHYFGLSLGFLLGFFLFATHTPPFYNW